MTKYRAVKETVDGLVFASRKEAQHYRDLKLLERAGKISGLELQPAFTIAINGIKCFVYKADFAYQEDGERVIVDCKGFKTPMYRLKKKCVEAAYGIKIKET